MVVIMSKNLLTENELKFLHDLVEGEVLEDREYYNYHYDINVNELIYKLRNMHFDLIIESDWYTNDSPEKM